MIAYHYTNEASSEEGNKCIHLNFEQVKLFRIPPFYRKV